MVARKLPRVDADFLRFILDNKGPGDRQQLILRMLTYSYEKPVKFLSRDEGGFIPDPRIRGIRRIAEAFDEARITTGLIFSDQERLQQLNELFEEKFDTVASVLLACEDSFSDANSHDMDEWAKRWFPPRTKGDLVLRRTRFYDLHKAGGLHLTWLVRECLGSDYVRALNCAWAMHILGNDFSQYTTGTLWWRMNDFDLFYGTLNDILKSNMFEEGWEKYAEFNALSGYRLEPWPGYDAEQQTEELSQGYGEIRSLYRTFKELTITHGKLERRRVDYLSFPDYVKSGIWLTTGSSSIGRLQIEYLGKVVTIKCRKNSVIDAVSKEDLIESCIKVAQTSKAFTKCELKKIRIAVASDIETYLKMNYIAHISGRGYQAWENVTRNEANSEKLSRMYDTVRTLRIESTYGMPWDYKGFEKQVLTSDIEDILYEIVEAGDSNVPDIYKREWEELTSNVMQGLRDSWITSPDGTTFKVKDGLPSGLYLTSIVGDGFNKVVSGYVIECMALLGYNKRELRELHIQGDDTDVISNRVAYCQMFDWLLKNAGFLGGTGKFGILANESEFLRVAYTTRGCKGYLMRAIPGIVQRKPWSDSPFDELDSIRAAIDAMMICSRRSGLNLESYADALLRVWCRKNKISYIAARTPTTAGGLGLSTPIADVRVTYKGKLMLPVATVSGNFEWRQDLERQRADRIGVKATNDTLLYEFAERKSAAITVNDQLRYFSKDTRTAYLSYYQTAIVKHLPRISVKFRQNLVPPSIWLRSGYKDPRGYGTLERDYEQLSAFNDFRDAGVTEETKEDYISRMLPAIRSVRSRVPNLTRKDADLWFSGKLSTYIAGYNAVIASYVALSVAANVIVGEIPRGRLSDVWCRLNMNVIALMQRGSEINMFALW